MGIRRLVVAVTCVMVASSCSLSADRRAQAPATSAPSRPTLPTTTLPPTPTTGPPFVYRVQQGETLSAIAAKFRVALSVIMARNHLTNADVLKAGQTLHIPSAPPLALTITPNQGRAGEAFHFTLTGAVPSETIVFTVVSPAGRDTGGPHTTSDGTVIATYHTAVGDPPGLRTVLAVGNLGTSRTAQFMLTAAPSAP